MLADTTSFQRPLISRGLAQKKTLTRDRRRARPDGVAGGGAEQRPERLPRCLSGLAPIFRTVELCDFMLRATRLGIQCGPRAGSSSLTLSEAAADYRRLQYREQYLCGFVWCRLNRAVCPFILRDAKKVSASALS